MYIALMSEQSNMASKKPDGHKILLRICEELLIASQSKQITTIISLPFVDNILESYRNNARDKNVL